MRNLVFHRLQLSWAFEDDVVTFTNMIGTYRNPNFCSLRLGSVDEEPVKARAKKKRFRTNSFPVMPQETFVALNLKK